MTQQPEDEALILVHVNYPSVLAIPASLATQVLPKLEVWSRQYKQSTYVTEPQPGVQMEMHLLSERDVIAARMLAAMQPKEES
jgi:hypothetical protein